MSEQPVTPSPDTTPASAEDHQTSLRHRFRRAPRGVRWATLPGLGAEVEVIRDAHGIPQIYADTDDDLMRAQGFVHAQDRFFEMDVRRHVTAGRLSEIFGPDTLETDEFIRTMGWRNVAEEEWAILEPATRG